MWQVIADGGCAVAAARQYHMDDSTQLLRMLAQRPLCVGVVRSLAVC